MTVVFARHVSAVRPALTTPPVDDVIPPDPLGPDLLGNVRPLRILTALYDFAPGGVERVAARLHAAWRADGIASALIVGDLAFPPPLPLTHVAQAEITPRRRGFAGFVALVLALRRQVRDDRPDVLFCPGNTYTVVAVFARLLIGPDCPPIIAKISNCLVRPDMPVPLRWLYRIWLRLQGRWIDHFVALAPAMRDEIAQFMAVAPDRISVIEDPALGTNDPGRLAAARDAAEYSVRQNRAGRHYVAVGRLAPQKNFALLLDAFAQIANPEDRLTILGEGMERGTLERKVRELRLERLVNLPGHVDPLDSWLAQADALVMSSDYEGVPAVLIGALAAGMPVVATRCCVSMDDLLGHGQHGHIVPIGNPAALADAMASIVRPEPSHVAAARRAAATLHVIDQASGRYIAAMRALADHRTATAHPRECAPHPATTQAIPSAMTSAAR